MVASNHIMLDCQSRTIHQVGKDKARPALTLIGYEDELRPAMAYVFGSTFICDTMLNAKQVHVCAICYTLSYDDT